MNRKWLIGIIIFVAIIGLGIFIWDAGQDDSNESTQDKASDNKKKPSTALTLEKDAKEQQELQDEEKQQKEADKRKAEEEKKEQEKKKKDKSKKDEKIKDDKKKDSDTKEELTNSTKYILTMINKPSSVQEKESTQAKLRDVSTDAFMKKFIGNNDSNAEDKTVEFRNVNLVIDNEDNFKSNNVKGTVTYDQIIKPKNDNDEVQPSVQVNNKMKLWFKKEDGKFKVDNLKV